MEGIWESWINLRYEDTVLRTHYFLATYAIDRSERRNTKAIIGPDEEKR